MEYEWDNNKNRINQYKHGISFETAILAFDDPFILTRLIDNQTYDEERWASTGLVNSTAIFIIHTWRLNYYGEEINRIISARAATPCEEQRYYSHRKSKKGARKFKEKTH